MDSLGLFVGLIAVSVVLVCVAGYELLARRRLLSARAVVEIVVVSLSYGVVSQFVSSLGGSTTSAALAGLGSFLVVVGVVWFSKAQIRNQRVVIWRQRLGVLAQLASAGVSAGSDSATAISNALELPGDKYWVELRDGIYSDSISNDQGAISHRTNSYRLAQRLSQLGSDWEVSELRRLGDIVSISDSGGFSKSALERFSESVSRSVSADTRQNSASRSQLMLLPVGLLFVAFAVLLAVITIQLVAGLSL